MRHLEPALIEAYLASMRSMIDASHNPNITVPEALADVLDGIARP